MPVFLALSASEDDWRKPSKTPRKGGPTRPRALSAHFRPGLACYDGGMIEQKYLRIVRAVQRAELPAEVGFVLKPLARARGPPRVRSSGAPAGRLEMFNRPAPGALCRKSGIPRASD